MLNKQKKNLCENGCEKGHCCKCPEYFIFITTCILMRQFKHENKLKIMSLSTVMSETIAHLIIIPFLNNLI